VRASLLAKGFRSMIRRYPADVLRAIRKTPSDNPDPFAADLSERWAALPELAGLAGAAWLGHCTTLVKIGGVTILTDPVLSSTIGPRLGFGPFARTIGPRRLDGMTQETGHMPRPDVIVLSHAHYDHLDRPTLRALAERFGRVPVVTAASTRRLVPRSLGPVIEIGWGGSTQVEGLSFAAIRPRHWGARNAWDRHRGYNSYIIAAAEDPGRVLFAGDTAHTNAYRAVGDAGGVDLAIFGIGAYDPWHHAHATPEEVWTMTRDAAAKRLLPVHYGTFKLSNEPTDEPIARLLAAAGGTAGTDVSRAMSEVLGLRIGEVWDASPRPV
jgi:L-ascorbate metabolism protein UlaG (beta-lactamase superfamily)